MRRSHLFCLFQFLEQRLAVSFGLGHLRLWFLCAIVSIVEIDCFCWASLLGLLSCEVLLHWLTCFWSHVLLNRWMALMCLLMKMRSIGILLCVSNIAWLNAVVVSWHLRWKKCSFFVWNLSTDWPHIGFNAGLRRHHSTGWPYGRIWTVSLILLKYSWLSWRYRLKVRMRLIDLIDIMSKMNIRNLRFSGFRPQMSLTTSDGTAKLLKRTLRFANWKVTWWGPEVGTWSNVAVLSRRPDSLIPLIFHVQVRVCMEINVDIRWRLFSSLRRRRTYSYTNFWS